MQRLLLDKYVVEVDVASFFKPLSSFMVQKVEAASRKVRCLYSADTVIPATSWSVDQPALDHGPSAQEPSAADPGPSTQEPTSST